MIVIIMSLKLYSICDNNKLVWFPSKNYIVIDGAYEMKYLNSNFNILNVVIYKVGQNKFDVIKFPTNLAK